MNDKKAIVLLSGGIDSATILAMVCNEGYEVYTLSFWYGQKHFVELDFAQSLAKDYKVKKHMQVDLENLFINFDTVSPLVANGSVPTNRSLKEMQSDVAPTYTPGRNSIFLSIALSWAETLGAHHIFIGCNNGDYEGYPDCRPQFIEAFQHLANVATADNEVYYICAPLLELTKPSIIRIGLDLGVDYDLTHSCYDPLGWEGGDCGECDACIIRQKAFEEVRGGIHS